ncbi:hypothetical protein ACWOFO_05810 [Carnobacterium maltaromaticum]
MNKDILIKFMNEEYIENFLEKGEIYFALNEYFINLDKEQNSSEHIADVFEGVHSRGLNPENTVLMLGIPGKGPEKRVRFNFKNAVFRETYKELQSIPISCFTLINVNSLDQSEDGSYHINEEVLNKLEGICNNRPCVVIAAEEFIEKMYNYAEENNLPLKLGPVKYYNEKIDENLAKEEFDLDPVSALLFKRMKYSDQKEYRIIYKKMSKQDKIIEIGSLKEFSFKLDSLNELRNLRIREELK